MARNKYDIDETLETPFNLKHLKRSFVYIKKYRKLMIFALILSALGSIMALFTPLITKESLDVAVPNKDISYLIKLTLLLVLAFVLSIAFGTLRSFIMVKVGQNIIFDIRQDLMAHLQKLPFSYYDSRPHGKILVRVINYVNSVADALSNGIVNFILEIFNIIFIAVFMFFVDARLALVVISGIPLFLVFLFIIKPRQRHAWQQVSNKNSNLNAYTHESINGAKVTQLFVREELNYGIYKKLSTAAKNAWLRAIHLTATVGPTVDNISTIALSMVYVAGLSFIVPPVSYTVLLAMGTYCSRFWGPINSLANIYNGFVNALAYLERIFETMDEPVEVDDIEGAVDLPPIKGEVEFRNVSFEYEKGIRVLNNVSFKVRQGESIALVGPTGAGKTTIINLISRFYNVTEGEILVDGTDISKVTLNSLHTQMGVMLQDSFIFSGSIKDNIRYGKLDADDREIVNAAKVVRADEFISKMPDGYNTQLNERGSRLSQGQSQLISFARTLISDPKILILDEATSSIDTKTEQLLQEGLNNLLKGRTSFIIAHRLSTIKNCDRIMFVDKGQIIESGSHEELLAKKGAYYNLYISQFSYSA